MCVFTYDLIWGEGGVWWGLCNFYVTLCHVQWRKFTFCFLTLYFTLYFTLLYPFLFFSFFLVGPCADNVNEIFLGYCFLLGLFHF